MLYKFTKSGEKVLNIASEIASNLGHSYIGTEHILYGLAIEENGVASKVLENNNIYSSTILERIEELLGREKKENFTVLGFTPRSKRILEIAYGEAKKIKSNFIGTEHILLGILKEDDSIAIRILLDLGINIDEMYREIAKVLNDFNEEINNKKIIKEERKR